MLKKTGRGGEQDKKSGFVKALAAAQGHQVLTPHSAITENPTAFNGLGLHCNIFDHIIFH